MTDTSKIRFFRQDAVDSLKKNVQKNLSWYREQNNTDELDVFPEYGEISKQVDQKRWDQLNENCSESHDVENVIAIYQGLELTPQQASEERIWVYATHCAARNYTARRWNKIPQDDDKAVKYILAHYFVSSTRGLIRDNAVARLWWMGHLASRCQDYDLKDTLDILLQNSDVRANLLERPSVSTSKETFSAVIRALSRSREASPTPALYERENFRTLMKTLNQRGGRIMLNVLRPRQLDNMIDNIVEKIAEQA